MCNTEVYNSDKSEAAMKAVTAAFFLMSVPLLVIAKGPTLKIRIQGADLTSPVETTENAILEKFDVWAGAGVEINGIPQTRGFIVDWEKGPIAEPPKRLPRYEVSFDVMHQRPSSYVISYSYDPATRKGYVYLPGKGENFYASNTFLILRGVDGNWLSATESWIEAANSLIGRARAARQASR
jgi:hypothetical protein